MADGLRVVGLRAFMQLLCKANLQVSFSQEGEDRILGRLFEDQPTGFYVDVGALHPVRFSNTLMLYLRGWRGVNIDATPGSMRNFRRLRSRDINLEVAIGTDSGPVAFHLFREPALNTFDVALANERQLKGWELKEVVSVRQRRLTEVWDQAVPPGVEVDLLTVDVEGRDGDVLRSLDWERQRPRVVCVEHLAGSAAEGSVLTMLSDLGYCVVARTVNSYLYTSTGSLGG